MISGRFLRGLRGVLRSSEDLFRKFPGCGCVWCLHGHEHHENFHCNKHKHANAQHSLTRGKYTAKSKIIGTLWNPIIIINPRNTVYMFIKCKDWFFYAKRCFQNDQGEILLVLCYLASLVSHWTSLNQLKSKCRSSENSRFFIGRAWRTWSRH